MVFNADFSERIAIIMIIVLSPAKSLDFDAKIAEREFTIPSLLDHAERLMGKLKKLSARQIKKLMQLSDPLATLNCNRYSNWTKDHTYPQAKPALFVFRGDVYRGLNAENFTTEDVQQAQHQLRILSGLYGLLRPLDLIHPYRLEMGTRLKVTKAKDNLYKYWGTQVTEEINQAIKSHEQPVLINLASIEYFKVLQAEKVNGRVLTLQFKELKEGTYKTVMTYAKIARGMMAAFIIKHRIKDVSEIKSFGENGYAFNPNESTVDEWVFTRDHI